MSAKSYPFIDIAVHERVREHFAKGDAAVLFSPDMSQVLWSNGEGASLFGLPSIYDFIDTGANRTDAAYRQMEAAARQLTRSGDQRSFLMRVASGFQRVSVNASVALITVRPGETAILFAAPRAGKPLALKDQAAQMISGFDDPDTHMAVLDGDGGVLAASPGFEALSMTAQTCRSLVAAVGRDSDWLLKRPIPTGKGHLPAAIGKLSDNPALHILFAVETILGHLDPGTEFRDAEDALVEPAMPLEEAFLAPAVLPDEVLNEIEKIEDIAPESDVFSGVIDQLDAEPLLAQPSAELQDDHDTTARMQPEQHDDGFLPDPAQPDAITPAAATPDAGQTDPQHFPSLETSEMPEQQGLEQQGLEPVETQDASAGESLQTADDPVIHPDGNDDLLDETATGVETKETIAPFVAAEETVAVGHVDDVHSDGFVFNPNSRAVRFVWKIDADGRFSEISEEFATAVGPTSADIVGHSFTELADRYGFDPGNIIGDLLKRRDTWSGKTIFWPVEGTSLQVPLDLAALPTYSRNREFDGFRGFGIVRVADATEDSNAMGLTLGQDQDERKPEESVDPAQTHLDDGALNTAVPNDDTRTEDDSPEQSPQDQQDTNIEDPAAVSADIMPGDDTPFDDPFQGERPALKLVETPARRASDKVVQLDNHRPQGETLSRTEQAAFREIARQLGENFGKRPNEDVPVTGEVPGSAQDASSAGAIETADEEQSQKKTAPPAKQATTGDDVDIAASVPEIDVAETLIAAPETLAGIVPSRVSGSSSLTREILDNLPLALLVHGGDDLYHANAEFLRLTGYADLDALREEGGIDALFAGDDEGLFDLPDGTLMVIRKDGHLVAVTARLQSIRWEDKSALMMALSAVLTVAKEATAADVTEAVLPESSQQETETAADVQSLRMETEELRSILETATDGVVVVGADGEIRSVNRSASALFNYDDGEIRGKPFAMLFAHESQKAVLDYLAGLSGHGVASVLNDGREVIGREASGGFIPLFMTMGRLSSSNGFCAVIRDITQWKRTEEELRTAKRAAETANAHKSDFLARVSHEIRTPLNAIIGFSDMMASEHFGPIGNPRYVEYAGDIGRSGRHVLDIVNDLLDISKIEAGEMDLEFTAVEINDAVSEAVSLVQPQANSQRVIIRTSLSGSVPNVVADNRSIKQIALNILSNAIRFTPSGGQIVVSTVYEANGSVILRIRDTGVGMTRTELEQAMKPFRQVTTGTRKRGDGTGLGLPLTKAMAEANRAQFSINSAPNEGTLVEISFPSQRVLAN